MITSALKEKMARALSVLIYFYSAFTICFSSYISDVGIQSLEKSKRIRIISAQQELVRATSLQKELSEESKDILEASRRFTRLGALSVGNRVLKERRALLLVSKDKNQKMISSLENKLHLIIENKNSTSLFSKENLKVLSYQTWAVMGMFLLIQLISAVFTRSSFAVFALFLEERNRNKQLKNLTKYKKSKKGKSRGVVTSFGAFAR